MHVGDIIANPEYFAGVPLPLQIFEMCTAFISKKHTAVVLTAAFNHLYTSERALLNTRNTLYNSERQMELQF